MARTLTRLLTTLLPLAALLAACTPAAAPRGRPEAPYPPPRPPAVGDILHLPTGTLVSEAQMLAAVSDARIAYVGETHDNPAAHRLQLKVLTAMADRHPGRVALGMEMLTPTQQDALDRWVAGELSEKEFLRAAGWYRQWQMDFAYYRDLLLFARERGIPVLGLNADKDLVRTIGRTPLEELTDEDRARLPAMDLGDPYQRALLQAIFGDHDQGNGRFGAFLRVQTLWDETMAENIATYLASPQGEEMRMVVIAGGNHIRHGFGIPRRVFRRVPTSYVLVGSRELAVTEKREERLMDVKTPPFPMPPYDFVAFTEYESLASEGVRLGVLLTEDAETVAVKAILPGSVAEEAGISPGDRVLALDGMPVRESFDVIYEVKQKAPGDSIVLAIERNGEPKNITLTFPATTAQ